MRALILIVTLTCIATPASAWVPLSTCGSGYTAWPAGSPHTVWHYAANYPSWDFSVADTLQILDDSFDEWGTPGCSSFTASQAGDTSQDPMGWNATNAVGFYETSFPASLGSGTLAVTFPSWGGGCALYNANMAFNGYHHQWVAGAWGNDLQSVATHEVGHWIGLDHSSYGDSTMTAWYGGGVGDRTVSCDDTDAVCTLYPSGGTSCDTNDDCSCGVTCSSGWCGGVVSGDDDDDDDDDDSVSGDCGGPEELVTEVEPNDNNSAGISQQISSGGGDLVIEASIWCNNNGNAWTGDVDWFVVDLPCNDLATFTIDGHSGADIDFWVYGSDANLLVENLDEDYSGPITGDAYGGDLLYIAVACWSGLPTDYTLTIDWFPWGPDGDDDDSTPPGDDDDSTPPGDDDDSTPPPADDDDSAAAEGDDDDSAAADDGEYLGVGAVDYQAGCGCDAAGARDAGPGLGWLAVAPLLLRRRR